MLTVARPFAVYLCFRKLSNREIGEDKSIMK